MHSLQHKKLVAHISVSISEDNADFCMKSKLYKCIYCLFQAGKLTVSGDTAELCMKPKNDRVGKK